jgi:predicted Zn-ribbon and HTH transcriptional regulator
MASEEHEEVAVAVDLPQDLREWLDEQAAARGVDESDLLRDLLAAHRAVDREDGDLPGGDVTALLDDRLADQREEFVDLLQDVRKRVVQVKRETDAKAPADHDHDDLADDVADLGDRIDDLDDDLDALSGSVDEARTELDAGFENFSDVLDYLADTTDVLERRMDTLAKAVVEARTELRRQAVQAAVREETAELKLAANQHGIRSATCEECGASVEIGLLTQPECPHCASGFDGIEPKARFFGSNVLTTGEPPALEGAVDAGLDTDLDDLVETDTPVEPTPDDDRDAARDAATDGSGADDADDSEGEP